MNILANLSKMNIYIKNNKGQTAKEMTTSSDIMKIFNAVEKSKNNENQGGLFASLRNNRHI